MIIFGWGKVTKSIIGSVFKRTCNNCNTTALWQLFILRTWFTLFFIPIIPYSKQYGIGCPKCGSYIQLTEEQFAKIKQDMTVTGNTTAVPNTASNPVEDSIKYAGKTATQNNYLKQMEELNNQQRTSN